MVEVQRRLNCPDNAEQVSGAIGARPREQRINKF